MNNIDQVSPAYVGFYHIPLTWCSERPSDKLIQEKKHEELFKIVYEGSLSVGIPFRVRRDGLIWFDCNKWNLGTYTNIPAYVLESGVSIPDKVVKIRKVAEERAYNRAMLLNAYQLCLNRAFIDIGQPGTPLADPVEPTKLIHLKDFSNPISTLLTRKNGPYGAYINHTLTTLMEGRLHPKQRRRLIPDDVIVKSFKLLDEIFNCHIDDAIKLVELLYWSYHRFSNNAFSESLIISWAICEKLINNLWVDYIQQKKTSSIRINSKRLQKLKGAGFNSSILSEMLELSDVISITLFKKIDKARKKRNDWLHSLGGIKDQDALNSLEAATELFRQVTGLQLRPQISRVVAGAEFVNLEEYSI